MVAVASAAEYIQRRVVADARGCWIWQLSTNEWGYGRARRPVEGERSAHRISFRAFKGAIPEGLLVLHRCDVRRCINPEHLFLGTHSDNVQDCISKGRHVAISGEQQYAAKLTLEAVRAIRSAVKPNISALARTYGVSRTAVRLARQGKSWAR